MHTPMILTASIYLDQLSSQRPSRSSVMALIEVEFQWYKSCFRHLSLCLPSYSAYLEYAIDLLADTLRKYQLYNSLKSDGKILTVHRL